MLFNYLAHVPGTHMANCIYLVDTCRFVSGLVQLAPFIIQTYYMYITDLISSNFMQNVCSYQ